MMPPFSLPAEFSPQKSILLAWPHQRADWPGKFAPIPWVYVEIIRHITATQALRLIVKDKAQESQARDMLERGHANLDRITFHRIPTNRVWMRDSGPMIVHQPPTSSPRRGEVGRGEVPPPSGGRLGGGQSATFEAYMPPPQPSPYVGGSSPHPNPPPKGEGKALLDFRFTAWAKYANHKLDNQVPTLLNTSLKLPLIKPMHKGKHVVLEGGGIDVNGKGALLTTEEWLLSDVQVRNPGFTRADYEEIFARYFGVKETIWLGHGIAGDDTHGHVDDITRFTDANTIVTVVEPNRRDANHAPLAENLKRLKRTRYTIAELPMPRPLMFEGTRLPASYANFLITNKAVLVPTFNDPADRIALSTLAELFPGRNIIPIHAVDLVWGFGTLHCMSMQLGV